MAGRKPKPTAVKKLEEVLAASLAGAADPGYLRNC